MGVCVCVGGGGSILQHKATNLVCFFVFLGGWGGGDGGYLYSKTSLSRTTLNHSEVVFKSSGPDEGFLNVEKQRGRFNKSGVQ